MHVACRLCDLKCGEKCRVLELKNERSIRKRLRDIGIIRGTEVECFMKSLFGEPVAYYVKGTVVALRLEETKLIEVEVIR